MALSKEFLTGGSGDGRGIKVTGTATGTAVTVHTVPAGAIDTVRLYARNDDTVLRTLTVEFGGTTDPDDQIKADLQPGVLTLVVPALPLGAALAVKAFADAADVVVIHGDVNRVA